MNVFDIGFVICLSARFVFENALSLILCWLKCLESILPRWSSWFAAFVANRSATVAAMFSLESPDWIGASPAQM